VAVGRSHPDHHPARAVHAVSDARQRAAAISRPFAPGAQPGAHRLLDRVVAPCRLLTLRQHEVTIEIIRITDQRIAVMRRVTMEVIQPQRVAAEARQLFGPWRKRGANAARILNHKGVEIDRWAEK
jgi:hypothetical protein